jgi:EcsC protein family
VGLVAAAGAQVAKHVAPAAGGGIVRDILERAIDGAGPLPGAAKSADAALRNAGGNVDGAIDALITQHQRLAGAQGFLTNIGGLITAAVTIPLNIAGVMVLQCRLAAAILHLRGYDLAKPSVRDAVLVCLLDSDARTSLSKSTGVTIKPASVAATDLPPGARSEIAKEVTGEILALAGGKQIARFFARRIPVLGGVIGGFGDARATKRIGRETATTPRARTE